MRRRIDFTQTELDEIAKKASQLSDWLEEKTIAVTSQVLIPTRLTVVASLIVAGGAVVLLDGATPDVIGWQGDCFE
jgi:hypothetical protein